MIHRLLSVEDPKEEGGLFKAHCSCGWTRGSVNSLLAMDEWHVHVSEVVSEGLKFPPSGPLETFDAAIQTVTQQRGEVYGHPAVDFDRASRLIAVVDECLDPLVRHALRMICVKIARLIHTPDHADSLADISGYARTIAMILDRREKEK